MNAPLIDLAELRARTPLQPLISRHVPLKREGRYWKGCCPFHGERTPSFIVYPDHFHCFGCGAHGDAISFTTRLLGLDFHEAVERLAAEAGMDAAPVSPAERARRDRAAAEARRRAEDASVAREAAEAADAIAYAQRRVVRTVALADTLASRYLTETRRVPEPNAWPESLRYDPRARALVAVATDAAGEVCGAQWIYLTPEATKIDDAERQRRRLPAIKQTFGALRYSSAVVRLPALHPGPLMLVEGAEDAASVWVSTAGNETWAALGGFNGVKLPTGRTVVVCADDDERSKPSLRKAMAAWRRAGVDFVVVRPWAVRRENGSDFNDLLANHGTGAVEGRILDALEPGYRAKEPGERDIVRWRTGRTFEMLGAVPLMEMDELPAATLARSPAGIGKTAAVHKAAIELVRKMRAEGDHRTVAIASPRHNLNDEQAERLRELVRKLALDLSVAVLRGHNADDPDAPGEKMCRAPADYMAARARRLDPRKTVCRGCVLNGTCGISRQETTEADIWMVTHQHPLHRKPKRIGKLAWLVFDEDPTGAALFGIGDPNDPDADDKPIMLRLSALQRRDRVKTDAEKTDRLADFNAMLAEALWTAPDGPLLLSTLGTAGITADAAEQTIGLEYDTEVEVKIEPDTPIEECRELLKKADINRDLGARVMLKREVARQLSKKIDRNPRVEIFTFHDDDGPHRAVRMMGKRDINAGWKVPTAVASATAQTATLRHLLHGVKEHDFGSVKAPHRYIRQVVDRAYSLAMLDADAGEITKKERARRTRNLRDLHAWLYRQALEYAPGQLLIVAQARLIPQLKKLGPLPANVEWGHHGAITGLDCYKEARAIIVIGRTQPKPQAMERAAEAMSGREVEHLPPSKWYPLRDAKRELATGELVLTEAEFHPDELVEALRWRSCEGELMQIVERGRGVNRTADNPLDVWLLTNVPVPLPIDEMIYSDELRPRIQDIMLAETGRVFLTNSMDAARAQHLDVTEAQIARKAATLRQRVHDERDRYGRDWRPSAGLVRVGYRKDAPGAHHEVAWVDPARIPDPGADLAALLGPMSYVIEAAPSGPSVVRLPQSELTERMTPEASPWPIWTEQPPATPYRAERPPDG